VLVVAGNVVAVSAAVDVAHIADEDEQSHCLPQTRMRETSSSLSPANQTQAKAPYFP
jgi:hypothetical protein